MLWKYFWLRFRVNGFLGGNGMTYSEEYYIILKYLKDHYRVQEMKNYIQHGSVTTFKHCENVARMSYNINKRFHLNSDVRVLLVGAMLHDFYLYEWHNKDDKRHNLHGFFHAREAYKNAKKYFRVDKRAGHVIDCHMWPLNLTRIPKSREAWIVCTADKIVSLCETLQGMEKSARRKIGA